MDIFSNAVINLHLQPDYFWDISTEKDIYYLNQTYYNNYKEDWEKLRFLATVQASCFSDLKGNKLLDFPWDKEDETILKLTKEEKDNLLNNMLESLNKIIK